MTDLRKAAEMALEALEIWEKMQPNTTACAARISAVQALRQALAQPEQEPVAWVYNGILHEFDPSEFATSEVKPLYTAPPKREWVGLTIDEVLNLLPSSEWKADVTLIFAKAIEAKLKEKNT